MPRLRRTTSSRGGSFSCAGRRRRKGCTWFPPAAGSFPRPASVLLRMAARTIASAPVVIAVANTGELIRHGGELFKIREEGILDFFRTMEIQSSAAAVENLLLAAASLGLASVWWEYSF